GAVNVRAPPPNNSVKRTAFRGRLLRALGVGVGNFQFRVAHRNMQRIAQASTRATSVGIGAVVARAACGKVLGASFGVAANFAFNAFASFTAQASSLRSPARPAWWHRRLTTQSSGRRSGAAYFGR